MAGEIALARPGEIEAYRGIAAANHMDELHFYATDGQVPMAVFQSISSLGATPSA